MRWSIIPLREKTGNYDSLRAVLCTPSNYTTTRENRELRPNWTDEQYLSHYTTTRENRELRHDCLPVWMHPELYHYERKQGTTTSRTLSWQFVALYHYERKQGTTTLLPFSSYPPLLYHYERKLGTTTYAIEPHPHRGKRSGVERGQCRAGITASGTGV